MSPGNVLPNELDDPAGEQVLSAQPELPWGATDADAATDLVSDSPEAGPPESLSDPATVSTASESLGVMEPEVSEDPVIPEEPEVSEDPVIPEEPEVSEDPVIPEEPEVSEDPVIPEEPEVSEDPVIPEEPEVSEDPVIPEEPEVSEDPVIPEEPEAPSVVTVPAAPTGLTLGISREGYIQLTWVDAATDENGYSVARSESDIPWTELATFPADQTQFTDTGVLPGVTYCYRVAAFNGAGSSAYTEESCISLPYEEDGTQQPTITAGPRIVPWLELNGFGLSGTAYVADGLLIWQDVTDTAIVSTIPGAESIYPEIQRRVPDMRIIPGIKTGPLFAERGFDSVAGWEEVAASVRLTITLAGVNVVVLENETALNDYLLNGYQINWQLFRQGLRKLPSGITILWYPSASRNVERMDLHLEMCRVVQEICTVQFIDTVTLAMPEDVGALASTMVTSAYDSFALQIPVPLVYCMSGPPWWPVEEVANAAALSRAEWAIIYPGYTRWLEAAQLLAIQSATVIED